MNNQNPNKCNPLGQNVPSTQYYQQYNNKLLFPIPRMEKRLEIGIKNTIFFGIDIWNAYEVSWLNTKGKPVVAIAQFLFDANSPYIIESKSFKLYLNSFNQTKFISEQEVKSILEQDLSKASNSQVRVKINLPESFNNYKINSPKGICLDRLDIEIEDYNPDSNLLIVDNQSNVEEILYSDLLKSNCLVTGQPDWASIQIGYSGKAINQEGLLKYLIGFRNHQEFHEQCVERIFFDILNQCQPLKLWVYAQYTRRGGLDINPFRTNINMAMPEFVRTARQ